MQARNAEEYFANKNSFTTGPMELRQRFEDGENMVIVDVRKEEDYRQGHVPGAINVCLADGHVELVKNDDLWKLEWHKNYVVPAKRPGLK